MGFAEYSASKSHRKLPRGSRPLSLSLSLSLPSLSLSLSLFLSLVSCAHGNTIKSSAISKSARALPRSAYSELEADGTRLRAYHRWNTWSKIHCVARAGQPRRGCGRGSSGTRQGGRSTGSLSRRKASNRYSFPPHCRRVFPTSGMRRGENGRKRERERERERNRKREKERKEREKEMDLPVRLVDRIENQYRIRARETSAS